MPLMRWIVADGCDLFVSTFYGDKDTSIICQVYKEWKIICSLPSYFYFMEERISYRQWAE